MNFKKLILATLFISSIAYAMDEVVLDANRVNKDHFIAALRGERPGLHFSKPKEEGNVHKIKDLGTKINFKKRNRTLENWIKRVQAGDSPLFGKTPLFEYLYSEKKLIPTGTIDTISFTQTESLHNGAWLYVSNVRKYYIDYKTYVRMGAFLRIIDDIAVMKKQVVFASSSTTPCTLCLNKTDLLRDYHEKYGSSHAHPYSQKKHINKRDKKNQKRTKELSSTIPMADPLSGYFYLPQPTKMSDVD
jgi:hypothetical protein